MSEHDCTLKMDVFCSICICEEIEAKEKRIAELEAENERLTAELKATQENEQHLSDANKPLLAENERLTAVYEAAKDYIWSLSHAKTTEAMNCYCDGLKKALAAVCMSSGGNND